ncbi:MAG: EcsC family protein [Clostridia bacterium]|nr:EcsC family protein [Clostridia bacterium]
MNEKLKQSVEKELKSVKKEEKKLRKKALKNKSEALAKIESKIPEKVRTSLQKAFAKAFNLIFKHGISIVERFYDKEEIQDNYEIHDTAIDKNGTRRELRRLKRNTRKKDFLNMSFATVEGVGLGVLGIGIPDIIIFIGVIFKGIYEISAQYGFDYTLPEEKYLILSMIKASLSDSPEWERNNMIVDTMLASEIKINDDILKNEVEKASNVIATDMLILKFIQGLPIVGVVGGVFNPIYYNKIMNYVRLKYHKRYLLDKLKTI